MKSMLVFTLACGSSQGPAGPGPAAPPAGHAGHAGHADHAAHGEHGRHEHHGPVGHRFEKADDWVPMFDDPQRDAWQKPDQVVAALAIAPNMSVADVGAGTGYFESRLAAAVGAGGKVLAVDIEPDMVRYIGERARRETTPNVAARLATAADPKLAPASVDRILVVDVWHHVDARVDYARKLAAALKPGGFVLIVDFTLESKKGPPPEHRLGPDAVRADLEQAGLTVSLVEAGLPDQYVLKGTKAP